MTRFYSTVVQCICTAIWAEQSVCTGLDENNVACSILLRSKNVRKEDALFNLKETLLFDKFDTSNIE